MINYLIFSSDIKDVNSWPKAVAVVGVALAIAWVIVAYIKY